MVGPGVTQMGMWSQTLGSQHSWGHSHDGLDTPDHMAWGVDAAGATQIRVWILLGSHTVMGTFLASHTGAHAHDVTQTGEKVMLEVCIGDQE